MVTGLAALLLAACGRTVSATPPGSSPSPSAETGAIASPYHWQRSPSSALAVGGGASSTLAAVLAPALGSDVWVAAGTVTGADGTSRAAAWRSTDARHWRRVLLPGRDGRALGAATFGEGTVVVGSVGSGPDRRAAVWLSTRAGGPWRAVPDLPAFGGEAAPGAPPQGVGVPGEARGPGGPASMDLVAAGTLGVFAAGDDDGHAAIWFSPNGTTWSTVASADELLAEADDATVTALAVDPFGVSAAGTVADDTTTAGAIWSSTDGLQWSSTGVFSGGGDQRIDSLAWTGAILVAAGAIRPGASWVPATWFSLDHGATWSSPDVDLPETSPLVPGTAGAVVRAVAAAPATVAAVAAGSPLVAVGGTSSTEQVWTSGDGTSWAPAALPAAVSAARGWVADLVATDGTTTVVADGEAGEPYALVGTAAGWQQLPPGTFGSPRPTAEPVALVHDGSRLLLAVAVDSPGPTIGQAGELSEVLASGDGRSWQELASLPGVRLSALAVTPVGLLAGGRTAAGEGLVLSSPTGAHWARSATFAAGTTVTAVARLGDTDVAVGTAPAGGRGQPVATAWSDLGGHWHLVGPLQGAPTVAAQHVLGACRGPVLSPATLVVVGDTTRAGELARAGRRVAGGRRHTPSARTPRSASTSVIPAGASTLVGPAAQDDEGTDAAAWTSTEPTRWRPGTVLPGAGLGADEALDGCMPAGSGYVGWGAGVGPSGAGEPALWRSADGARWVELALRSLARSGPPLVDLAASGTTWLAASGPAPAAALAPDDALRATGQPLLSTEAVPAVSSPSDPAGLWLSSDDGTTWEQIDTAGAAWDDVSALSAPLVTWLGTAPVVAGSVDGRLAVWVGTPSPAAGASGP